MIYRRIGALSETLIEVNNPKEFIMALCIARNAFLNNVSINVNNLTRGFSNNLSQDIQEGINGIYSSRCGFFPTAQASSYSSRMVIYPFGLFAHVQLCANYLSTEKENSDFTCIAAEISELLNKDISHDSSDMIKVKKFVSWLKKNFEYKCTDTYADHSAVELLKNRTGVCQAIAALAVKVLPFMGIKTQYVTGVGKGVCGWGNHAWNIICLNGEWVHVDFTFALNSFVIPMTDNVITTRIFEKTHKWDAADMSDSAIEVRENLYDEIEKGEIILYKNKEFFTINSIKIHTKLPIYRSDGTKDYIRIGKLVKYLGGGCELEPYRGHMRICVNGKVINVNESLKYLNRGTDEFDIKILQDCGIRHIEMNNKIMLTFR